jgi:hypothetical protein
LVVFVAMMAFYRRRQSRAKRVPPDDRIGGEYFARGEVTPSASLKAGSGLARVGDDVLIAFEEQGQGVPNAKYRVGEPQDALATKKISPKTCRE